MRSPYEFLPPCMLALASLKVQAIWPHAHGDICPSAWCKMPFKQRGNINALWGNSPHEFCYGAVTYCPCDTPHTPYTLHKSQLSLVVELFISAAPRAQTRSCWLTAL